MKEVTKTVWYADDGTMFDSLEACGAHELEVAKETKSLKFYRVWYAPELTEGRGMQRSRWFVLRDSTYNCSHEALIRNFMGKEITLWYGNSPHHEYTIHLLTHDVYAAHAPSSKEAPVLLQWDNNKCKTVIADTAKLSPTLQKILLVN
jgi:hypothetical protein